MVKTELISFYDGIAKVNCYPEGNTDKIFQLLLDVEKQKIISNTLNEKGNAYAIHAAWKMFDAYMTTGTLPETATVIWC